jgi:hypothetical protein
VERNLAKFLEVGAYFAPLIVHRGVAKDDERRFRLSLHRFTRYSVQPRVC